jgi:hypothetical protein
MVHFYRIWRFPENGGTPNGLVGGIPPPLKNMSSPVGVMTFSTGWKNNPNVPNHHPVINLGKL